jgi:two-component SAPR family response regulator
MAVDNDISCLGRLEALLRKACPQSGVIAFTNPLQALEYAARESVDALFTEVQMKEFGGIPLAEKLREKKPDLYVALTADGASFSPEVWKYPADDYLLKPVTEDMLANISACANEEMRQPAL